MVLVSWIVESASESVLFGVHRLPGLKKGVRLDCLRGLT
jgi:hypothetical protein